MNILEFLRDSIWQSVGAVLALLTIFLTVWIFKKQQSKKLIVYRVGEITPLVTTHESVKNDFKIMLRGHEVSEAYSTSINIYNKGNLPVTKNDYDEKLKIRLSENGEVIRCNVIDSKPTTIGVFPSLYESNSIIMEPFLLNPGERFTISSVVINGNISVSVTCRIVGGSIKSQEELDNTAFKNFIRSIPIPVANEQKPGFLFGFFTTIIAFFITIFWFVQFRQQEQLAQQRIVQEKIIQQQSIQRDIDRMLLDRSIERAPK